MEGRVGDRLATLLLFLLLGLGLLQEAPETLKRFPEPLKDVDQVEDPPLGDRPEQMNQKRAEELEEVHTSYSVMEGHRPATRRHVYPAITPQNKVV